MTAFGWHAEDQFGGVGPEAGFGRRPTPEDVPPADRSIRAPVSPLEPIDRGMSAVGHHVRALDAPRTRAGNFGADISVGRARLSIQERGRRDRGDNDSTSQLSTDHRDCPCSLSRTALPPTEGAEKLGSDFGIAHGVEAYCGVLDGEPTAEVIGKACPARWRVLLVPLLEGSEGRPPPAAP